MRLLLNMGHLVVVKVTGRGEPLATNSTLVGLLSTVDPSVSI